MTTVAATSVDPLAPATLGARGAEALFVPKLTQEHAVWMGHIPSRDEAREAFGIRQVLYREDLSRLGPTAPGWHFNGTTLWTQLEGDEDKNQVTLLAAQPGRYVMPPYSPLTADTLRRCMKAAQIREMPSPAWLFLRDARSMYLGYDHRRAAIDAGSAAEVAVTQMITTHLSMKGLSDREIDQTLHRRTLGQRCRYWLDECGGALPDGYREQLVEIRNDATHIKRSVSRTQANDAIAVAAEIVAASDSLDLGPLLEEGTET